MNVYFSHHRHFDHATFYPLLKKIEGVNFIFPEETNHTKSKEIIRTSDAFIADVSEHSTGSGIEIGWADSFDIPIMLIFSKGSQISSSLKLFDNRMEYDSPETAAIKVKRFLDKLR